MLTISFKKIPTQELKSFASCVANLHSTLTKRALEAGYKESSKQLVKHYGLPEKGISRKAKPSTAQVLRIRNTEKDQLQAQDESISLLRFVVGSKKMKLKNVRISKRKGLTISLFPGTSWRTKKAFSASMKGNMHLFIKRKVDGKYRIQRQNVPSAFNVLTHDTPMMCIKKSLFDALGKNTFRILKGGKA
jgi:hypothetical protein